MHILIVQHFVDVFRGATLFKLPSFFILDNYLRIGTAVRVKPSPVHVHDTTTGMWLRYKSTYTDTTCRGGRTSRVGECVHIIWKQKSMNDSLMKAVQVWCVRVWPDDEPTKVCVEEGLVQSFATVGARSRQGDKWAYPR